MLALLLHRNNGLAVVYWALCDWSNQNELKEKTERQDGLKGQSSQVLTCPWLNLILTRVHTRKHTHTVTHIAYMHTDGPLRIHYWPNDQIPPAPTILNSTECKSTPHFHMSLHLLLFSSLPMTILIHCYFPSVYRNNPPFPWSDSHADLWTYCIMPALTKCPRTSGGSCLYNKLPVGY